MDNFLLEYKFQSSSKIIYHAYHAKEERGNVPEVGDSICFISYPHADSLMLSYFIDDLIIGEAKVVYIEYVKIPEEIWKLEITLLLIRFTCFSSESPREEITNYIMRLLEK
jgi:hypothetical protein